MSITRIHGKMWKIKEFGAKLFANTSNIFITIRWIEKCMIFKKKDGRKRSDVV